MTDSCWPMKSQNTRHTGLSHYSTYGNNGVVKWKYRVDGSINSGAIIDNNNYIYFGVNNFFYSLHPNGSLSQRGITIL